ncbi:uncharacterized protein [Euphorbia lathyris]|uniref:uncharacterized protein isoform X2 n=1 Tax=Euphorbia lathyris TaxID=212925 RepID=UPI003313DE11
MVSKKISSSPCPILIGNCEVVVETNNFTYISDTNNLQISTSRRAKIQISVKEEINKQCSDDFGQSKAEGEGRASTSKDDYAFILVNSKDSNECTKSYLQEALKIYTRELPAMNYAANTGKHSTFLEKCVSNGKYCSLLLKFKCKDNPGEVIAAISYQLVPANTQYAEIPLAAVSSFYQNKGLGRFLYMELRKRLSSVGVRVIYCWGDKESKGFWVKQGFESIAEVDVKGKARRLPIKADIRRALCFPGGSILMVSHLNEDSSSNYSELMEFQFPLKPHIESTSPVDKVFQPADGCKTLQAETGTISKESCHPEGLSRDRFSRKGNKSDGICSNQNFEEPDTFGAQKCSKNTTSAELDKIVADSDVECCSCFTQGKKRAWEASLSSLKSKKVKGSHRIECETESILGLGSGSDGRDPCYHGCSLGISKCSSFMETSAGDPLTTNAKEGRSTTVESGALISNELKPHGDRIRIMLMNIADDTKKTHLTKVIEILGGVVTDDGSSSTHVVTGKVRKTLNFCTALCAGAWIVSSSWLKESSRRGIFVDESAHILHDDDYVLKYRMGLKDAVLRAKASPRALFKGYNVCIASHVQPPAKTLSAIVMSAGGNIISGLEKVKETSKTIFIACEEDMEEALSAARKGILTFSCEWLMNCIMRQELDLHALQFAASL